jgi:hypothetical protein
MNTFGFEVDDDIIIIAGAKERTTIETKKYLLCFCNNFDTISYSCYFNKCKP